MFEGMLSDPGAIGSTAVRMKDGSIVFMYSTKDGKVFKKSSDNGKSFDEVWTVKLGVITANSNLIILKDGRLMMTLKKEPENETAKSIGGADFSVVFSKDDGKTWSGERKVNMKSGCYYLMNDRLLRLKSGRILMPLCYQPYELIKEEFFEKVGYSGCYYSDDEGQNWTEGKWLKGENAGGMLAEPMLLEREDGKVYMYMRTSRGYLYMSESIDGGETFITEKATSLRSPNAPFTVAKDDFSGKFFAVWDNSFPAPKHQYPRTPICMAVSDNGTDWSFLMELDNNPDQNYGYPSLVFTKDNIIVTYYFNNSREFDTIKNQIKIKILNRKELSITKEYKESLF